MKMTDRELKRTPPGSLFSPEANALMKGEKKPRSQWKEPINRPAAPPADTRQCKRYALFRQQFAVISYKHHLEPRRARRKIARAISKRLWRESLGTPS